MIGLLARFFFGETRYLLKVPAHVGANLFLHSGIPCFKGTAIGQQGYVISIETGDKKKLERLLAGNIEQFIPLLLAWRGRKTVVLAYSASYQRKEQPDCFVVCYVALLGFSHG